MKYIYMAVTKDKYELPVCIADSAKELASLLGVTPNNVVSSISKHEKGIYKRSKYIRVKVR